MESELILYNVYFRREKNWNYILSPPGRLPSNYLLEEDVIFVFETNRGLFFFAELPSKDVFFETQFVKSFPIYDLEKSDFTIWQKMQNKIVLKIYEILDNDPFLHILLKCRHEKSLFLYVDEKNVNDVSKFQLKEISKLEVENILSNNKIREVNITIEGSVSD